MKQKILFCLLVAATYLISYSAFAADMAYDRIMRTGTLRCGYLLSPDAIDKDPNTGKISGIIYDFMEEAGRLLNIKIIWAEELGWATTASAIQSGRVDALCTNFWVNPAESKILGVTNPLYFSAMDAYVRANDARFDNNLAAINNKDIRISGSDGEMATIIARQDFPAASVLALPNMAMPTQQLMEITNNKADVTFMDRAIGKAFMAANPNSIKAVKTTRPIRIFANTIAFDSGDIRLKNMLDAALMQIQLSGQLDRMIDKHEKYKGSYLRLNTPYRETAQ